MENKQVPIALWGLGVMNKMVLRMALEKNYKVVAVISTSKHGNDAGEEAGVGKINVPVTKREDAEAVLKETKP